MSPKINAVEEHEKLKKIYRPTKFNNKNNYRVVVKNGEVEVIPVEEEAENE